MSMQALPLVLLIVLLLLIVGSFGYTAFAGTTLPESPMPLVLPVVCAQCGMAVTEPPYAAQLITRDGKAKFFDDAGCLFEYQSRYRLPAHSVWFRHKDQDRWLPQTAVAFVRVPSSPMGYGLQAVEPGTAEAIPLGEARESCRRGPGATARR